ncbi:hypothetical protein [Williamsia deligens]|uniref:DinB family protein n=1 Tax=Williamsia deligens TaxID=321325 RepID=A0ABW3G9E9_9NOCA|nr:hypothetical protein [Williamsia deligens]MCP2192325.1 hypothetical protein [Williamsia deligens]
MTIAWRIAHVTEMLGDERNRLWLRLRSTTSTPAVTDSAVASVDALCVVYEDLREALDSSLDLGAEIGPAAGQYATSTRRSFLLHIAGELIYHAAEAALLRDLWAVRLH